MKRNLYLFASVFMSVSAVLTAQAQQRDKVLNVHVVTQAGVGLEGQQVNVEQTDYQLNYNPMTLDANGKCSMKIYPGNHRVTVERSGFNTADTTFSVGADESGKDIDLVLIEKTRNPFALNASCAYDAYTGKNHVTLHWNTEKPAFFDDFESYSPFAITFGDWTGIDGDHLMTAALSGDYPNRGVFQYAQIMNPLEVEPMWYYDYPILRAYSGKQYVGFVRTQTGDANDDWLISPEITVGTDNILSFYAKAADKYPEKFIVYVTTKTDNPSADDFTQISTGNYESVDYKGWHYKEYDLAQYAQQKVKIAVRYVGEANNGGAFMLMLDDFYVGQPESGSASDSKALSAPAGRMHAKRAPQRSAANPNEDFDIYIDGNKVGTTDEYTYTLDDVAEGTHTLGVKATYLAAQSDMTTTTVSVSTADYAALTANVSADSKLSVDGQTVNVLSLGNGELYPVIVKNGVAALKMLPKGNYQVGVEKGAFKACQKTVSLTADTSFDMTLEDDVLTPYNITADVSQGADGNTQAVVRWNQVLGFSDSFETYDDFATGEFGGWKSLDVDKLPVYPIALGTQTNIVSFPGSGTASSPKAIAPMVFNPWKTSPAMLPTDQAMQAPDGEKYVVFFSPQGGKADKWLISPLLDIYDDYDFKVTAKSYDGTSYPETLEFAVSEGGDTPDDFTTLSTAARMPGDHWTQYSTSLADYAGKKIRLGVHYVSYDTFFAQLDDVKVGPADGGNTAVDYGNVVRYDIYLDGKKVGESTTATFTISNVPAGSHTVGVVAVYKNSVSEMGTYNIVASGIGSVRLEPMSADAEVYDVFGRKINAKLQSLPRGVYVVKSGNSVRKVSR